MLGDQLWQKFENERWLLRLQKEKEKNSFSLSKPFKANGCFCSFSFYFDKIALEPLQRKVKAVKWTWRKLCTRKPFEVNVQKGKLSEKCVNFKINNSNFFERKKDTTLLLWFICGKSLMYNLRVVCKWNKTHVPSFCYRFQRTIFIFKNRKQKSRDTTSAKVNLWVVNA